MGDRMMSDTPLQVCNAVTKATFPHGTSVLFVLNHFMVDEDPDQTESLLNPHQCRAHKVLMDDVAHTHRRFDGSFGEQKIINPPRLL